MNYPGMENALFTGAMVLYLVSMVLYFVFFAMKKEKPGQFAGYALICAFVLHTLALIVRGIGAGRLPLTNQYEFATSFAWGIALCSLLFLLREKNADNEFWKKHVPEKEKLDLISYRAVALGFLFLTVVLVSGAIWAERAWGSYWSWDPKETWALITWIIYAIYLHLRINKGWKDKSAAAFAVVGFICVLFTYIGVNTFIPSIHSYA